MKFQLEVQNQMDLNWLTVSMNFYDIFTGIRIGGWDTPFNMTRLGPLQHNFTTALNLLISGHDLRFHVNTDGPDCSREGGGEREVPLKTAGGPVVNFEYFYGEIFAPVPFWGTSNYDIIMDINEVHFLRLTQFRIYASNTVRVRFMDARLNDSYVTGEDIIWCDLYNPDTGNGSATVAASHDAQPKKLTSYDAIRTSLRRGRRIRTVNNYDTCPPNPQETIGGAIINSYEISEDGNNLEYHVLSMIANYSRDYQYALYNCVTAYLRRDDRSATIRPWAIDYGTWNKRYVGLYLCQINNGMGETGVTFFEI